MIVVHAHPRAQALQESGSAALAGLVLMASAAAFVAALSDLRLFLMIGISLVLLVLTMPLIMRTAASPALEITDEALVLNPRVWRKRSVAWADIRALRDDPLLPRPEGEWARRVLVGRNKYQAARGQLIVIPSLPLQYRILGLFAGEGFAGAIAVTSRTHAGYEAAIAEIERRVEAAHAEIQLR